MGEEKKIAIWGSYLTWDGGIDFLCYLVNGLYSVQDKYKLKFYLLLPYDHITELKSFTLSVLNSISKGGKIQFNSSNVNDKIRAAFKQYDIPVEIVYYNYLQKNANKKLKKLNIDVLFPVIKSFKFDFDIPYVSYIPDLQHKHLPHFFSAKEIKFRDERFISLLDTSKAVIVNALAVKADIEKHYGQTYNVFSLPFCPPGPSAAWELSKEIDHLRKFSLPKRYFLISNQFWKHKDHITAFKAFNLLVKQPGYGDVKLYCTGLMQDPRFPEYVQGLKDFISSNQLQDKIRLLGYIAKEEQIALMNRADALIQPTLFEGGPGGGAVYNAIAMGTRCIVSDIPVNLEIDDDKITFFKAASPEDLARKMALVLNTTYQKPTLAVLQKEGQDRMQELGEALIKVMKQVNPTL